MRKCLLPIFAAVCVTASAQHAVPYSSNIGLTKDNVAQNKSGLDTEWETIDVEGDASFVAYTKWWKDTWAYPSLIESEFKKAGYAPGAVIYHSAAAPDDYLITPAITFEAGKTYRVRFAVFTDKDFTYQLTGSIVQGQDEDIVTDAPTFFDDNIKTENTWQRRGYTFTVPESGAYNISLHQCGEKGSRIEIADFSVIEDEFIPAAPADLNVVCATEDDPRALTVALSWVNPVADRDDVAFADDMTIESVNIYRDNFDEPVVKLEPAAVSWTDNAETGLTPGNHVYRLTVTVNGVEGEPVEYTTTYVGEVTPIAIPGVLTFVAQSDFDLLWKTEEGEAHTMNGATNFWRFSGSDVYGNCLRMYSQGSTASKPQQEDAWAFSPVFNFDEAGTYELDLVAAYQKSSKPTYDRIVEVMVGTGRSIAEWNNVVTVSEALPIEYTTTHDGVQQAPISFSVPTPGEYNLAIHANGPGNGCFYSFYRIAIRRTATTGIDNVAAVSAPAVVVNGSTVTFSAPASGVKVFNAAGCVVAAASAQTAAFDLSSLPAGFYIVAAVIDGRTVTAKVIL